LYKTLLRKFTLIYIYVFKNTQKLIEGLSSPLWAKSGVPIISSALTLNAAVLFRISALSKKKDNSIANTVSRNSLRLRATSAITRSRAWVYTYQWLIVNDNDSIYWSFPPGLLERDWKALPPWMFQLRLLWQALR